MLASCNKIDPPLESQFIETSANAFRDASITVTRVLQKHVDAFKDGADSRRSVDAPDVAALHVTIQELRRKVADLSSTVSGDEVNIGHLVDLDLDMYTMPCCTLFIMIYYLYDLLYDEV